MFVALALFVLGCVIALHVGSAVSAATNDSIEAAEEDFWLIVAFSLGPWVFVLAVIVLFLISLPFMKL